MLLSDKHLKELAVNHSLVEPFIEGNCEGATINLTLDSQIKKHISIENLVMVNKIPEDHYEKIDISETDFFLKPNESVLVQAFEYFKIPTNMAALILERYSIKLLGLVVSPASYMNPGYEGRMSFLLTNHSSSPVQLVAGVKFCQLGIAELSSESDKPYKKQDGKYMGSRDVHISKLHLDKDIQDYLKEKGLGEISTTEAKTLGKHLLQQMDKNAKKYVEIIRNEIGGFNESTS
ncbi:dCTP deaminase [Metabacillus indicus]|uniref:dCTP deaminase n=1 Tax=Metabacillus indicus TaxID=246786 RepID=UPI002A04B311|nr:dCTP deaminase [Metabacillus indicus]MDX8288822.1 dCTP deaminase [Metabacillus indicus]